MKSSAVVGFFTAVGIIALACLLMWKSGIVSKLQGFEMVGSFQNVSGLLEGAEVRYRGFSVGTVSKISPRINDILVHVKVNKKLDIPMDSRLRIEFDGLIGEKYIGVMPGKDHQHPYKPGQVLPGFSSAGIVDFVDMGTQNLEETKKILAMVYKMMEDGKVQESIRNILFNVEGTTAQLNDLIPSLKAIANNLSELTQSLSPILADKTVHQNIQEFVKNMKDLSSEANALIRKMETTTDQTSVNLNDLLKSAKATSESLNEILKDNELKEDLKGTLKSTKRTLDKLSGISSLDLELGATAEYHTLLKNWGYTAGITAGSAKDYWKTEISHQTNTTLASLQKGYYLGNDVGVYFGIVKQNGGLGFTYSPADFVAVSGELYNPNEVEAALKVNLNLLHNIKVSAEATDLLRRKTDNYVVGIGVSKKL